MLNRVKGTTIDDLHVLLKYIFPRQWGLHNVFTSSADRRQSATPHRCYANRDAEIVKHWNQHTRIVRDGSDAVRLGPHIPKRLRGNCVTLIEAVLRRHHKCPYAALLQHYCPRQVASDNTRDGQQTLGFCTPVSQVSAFCQAVVKHVFPGDLWNVERQDRHNEDLILQSIDKFINLQRHESLTLHSTLQKLRLSSIRWLDGPGQGFGMKRSNSDSVKRHEIFAELLYYLFDSFLIPLICNTFYVTESSAHRQQLYYFRHDMWAQLVRPVIVRLAEDMFERVPDKNLKTLLDRRTIGTSRVRLLPKHSGLRPIMNLRRRAMSYGTRYAGLGCSINTLLAPAFHALNLEKRLHPNRLGSSLFSPSDILAKLQAFRTEIGSASPLYFVKVDVQAAFDTIPQAHLLRVISNMLSPDGYLSCRMSNVRTLGQDANSGYRRRPTLQYKGFAQAADGAETFIDYLNENDLVERTGCVWIDHVVRRPDDKTTIIRLLKDHVQQNVVELGRRNYRQRTGIPQGSTVSSLLCSFFYADMEQRILGFTQTRGTLLLRLIDDFLLISVDRAVAERFAKVMHAGVPGYGVRINPAKSLTNFDMSIDGVTIARLPDVSSFPYCGYAINTATLNITKDVARLEANSAFLVIT